MQQIAIVVARNKERVIGENGNLPWHIPEDLKYFKEITYGHSIIMGRKTFESIGRALPGRKNIVLSKSLPSGYTSPPGIYIYNSLEVALKLNREAKVFIIGGEEIFKLALPIATIIYETVVDLTVDRPCAWFPKLGVEDWELFSSKQTITKGEVICTFNILYRKLNDAK